MLRKPKPVSKEKARSDPGPFYFAYVTSTSRESVLINWQARRDKLGQWEAKLSL